MIFPDTLMVDLKDKGENPAEAPYDCWIEIDDENNQAIICWVENLRFHAEYNGPREWTSEDAWAPLVDKDGWLTPSAEGAVAIRLQTLIKNQGKVAVEVDTSDYGGDEPTVMFEVVTDYHDGETYEHWLNRIGWPVVATLINLPDPGTFMSAYLFLAGELSK